VSLQAWILFIVWPDDASAQRDQGCSRLLLKMARRVLANVASRGSACRLLYCRSMVVALLQISMSLQGSVCKRSSGSFCHADTHWPSKWASYGKQVALLPHVGSLPIVNGGDVDCFYTAPQRRTTLAARNSFAQTTCQCFSRLLRPPVVKADLGMMSKHHRCTRVARGPVPAVQPVCNRT
jgi:hypothetical protein